MHRDVRGGLRSTRPGIHEKTVNAVNLWRPGARVSMVLPTVVNRIASYNATCYVHVSASGFKGDKNGYLRMEK